MQLHPVLIVTDTVSCFIWNGDWFRLSAVPDEAVTYVFEVKLMTVWLQGSGALSGSTLPMQQTGTAQRRTLQGQAMNAWPPNSARKESLHNGPISAQDLATSIRGRPASSDDSRQCASQPVHCVVPGLCEHIV